MAENKFTNGIGSKTLAYVLGLATDKSGVEVTPSVVAKGIVTGLSTINNPTTSVNFQYVWGIDGGGNPIKVSLSTLIANLKLTDNIGGMSISGTLNLTDSSTKATMEKAYNALPTGGMAFYLVADSSGNLPSLSGEGSVTMESSVAKLFDTSGNALGASVGDIVIIAKVKVLVLNVMVCRVLPLNDAKAANGSFPGAMGLESIWDKTQINKIQGIEANVNNALIPTRGGSNMNDCLLQGVYTWCTLGRPEGSTGAYTLVVLRTSSADGNGFYTVEQTAYGREGELGQVYKRLVFVKADGTAEYMDWVKIGGIDLE